MVPPPPYRRRSSRGRLNRIHLCTAVIERAGALLLVASRYPNHPEPLWNLPGGRQHPRELLTQTLVREVAEETTLHAEAGELLYISESYDGETHVTNATFAAHADGDASLPDDDAHIVAVEWVPREKAGDRISVAVVREPLVAFLSGQQRRYWGYAVAGISIEFAD